MTEESHTRESVVHASLRRGGSPAAQSSRCILQPPHLTEPKYTAKMKNKKQSKQLGLLLQSR